MRPRPRNGEDAECLHNNGRRKSILKERCSQPEQSPQYDEHAEHDISRMDGVSEAVGMAALSMNNPRKNQSSLPSRPGLKRPMMALFSSRFLLTIGAARQRPQSAASNIIYSPKKHNGSNNAFDSMNPLRQCAGTCRKNHFHTH